MCVLRTCMINDEKLRLNLPRTDLDLVQHCIDISFRLQRLQFTCAYYTDWKYIESAIVSIQEKKQTEKEDFSEFYRVSCFFVQKGSHLIAVFKSEYRIREL